MLHDDHNRVDIHAWRRARRTRGYGQDGDHQGSGQVHGPAVRGVQLRRGSGLQGHGHDLQRPGADGRVGLLRRVQPHHRGGALRRFVAGEIHPGGPQEQAHRVPVRGQGDEAGGHDG